MDQLVLEYIVSACGSIHKKNDKTGKEWDTIEYRGQVIDSRGNLFDCSASAAFGGRESCHPSKGDHVFMVVSDLDCSGVFPTLKFSDVLSIPSKK